MHMKKSGLMLSQYSWGNIAYVKALCNVVPETSDNAEQENVLFNVVLILLGQYCTGTTLCSVALEVPDNLAQEKNPFQCCLNSLGTTLHK